ncbi:coproporphyrinogen III oxidase [Blastomonas sp. CCH10-E1]|uniref:oxygen-dependent coproporphyrinogen-III oxidase n=1 Tax=Blastomonas sp. CCH10-E1 TaxID=1768737 RepID=UPI000825FB30|nr:coproporphyrinogen III oxidase [Blastomonas sp. CCH10-E1]
MTDWTEQKPKARAWFESLRDAICAEFTAIEREAGSDASFEYTPWERTEADGTPGGGGVRGLIKGKVFEKAGVNVSTVEGRFSEEFAKSIHGAGEDPRFFATGISLVAHMSNPHVPAVHMNTRFLVTTKAWFGGHNPDYHAKFKAWADDYFYIPHRGVHRGVGGIFYDHLECPDEAAFDANFAFTQDVGRAFLDIFPALVRRRMGQDFSPAEKHQQLVWRGRYAEFNLIHDRGTLFGLKTGGNIDAILMSLPPEAVWE